MINVEFKDSTKNIEVWKDTLTDMREHGMKLPYVMPQINVPNAHNILKSAFEYFIGLEGKKAVWLKEYDLIADWLTDNQGRGLLLYGKKGNGKSVMARLVIPAVLLKCLNKVVHAYDMNEMDKYLDEALSFTFVTLDDVGTESEVIVYGKRRKAFNELMDNAEKYGKMLIVTSNLSKDDFMNDYDDRVFDRMSKTMRLIPFNHESFRK